MEDRPSSQGHFYMGRMFPSGVVDKRADIPPHMQGAEAVVGSPQQLPTLQSPLQLPLQQATSTLRSSSHRRAVTATSRLSMDAAR